ncbi:MAG TPA: glycosyltransferase family 4 protein [Acidimicrobiales bacterium]|nr:glycosyltransferase family 4 protein [Acidimicrobiales bacterium]
MTSHPIQYQSPLWRALGSEDLDLEVLYLSRHGIGDSVDLDFGQVVHWDNDVLAGFEHRFVTDRVRVTPGGPLSGLTLKLVQTIVTARFDALLVMGYATAGYLLSALTAATVRLPLYLRGETMSAGARRAMGRDRPTDAARRGLLRGLLRLCAGAFPIGHDSELFYRELGVPAARLTPAPYGVDNSWFRRRGPAEIETLRDDLGLDPQRRLVLQTGKLIARKRPHHAAEVAAELRLRGIDAAAIIVGSGPLETTVRAAMADSDLFVGFVNQSQLPAFYALADVLLMPSTYETWGLVVNEALAAGTPVVASPQVPAAVEMAGGARGGAVQVVGPTHPGPWADACEAVLARNRGAVAQDAMAAVDPYDVRSTARRIAERIRADFE